MSDDPDLSGDLAVSGADELLLVLTNVGDTQTASRIAQALVEERLAACVNVLATCRSVYRWQATIEQADEVPLLIKTSVHAWPALSDRLRALHPYDVPEIVAWRPSTVDAGYRAWALGEIGAASSAG